MYKLNASAQNYRIAFYVLVWTARPKNPRKWVFIPFTRKHINIVNQFVSAPKLSSYAPHQEEHDMYSTKQACYPQHKMTFAPPYCLLVPKSCYNTKEGYKDTYTA